MCFHGKDQLVVQYILFGSIIDQENRGTVLVFLKDKQAWHDVSIVCVSWEDFPEARSGGREMEREKSP